MLLRSDADVLLLDEPDNFLDVDAKRWLEGELQATRKTVLYVSHDRELLAATATKIVTIEGATERRGRSAAASPAMPTPAGRTSTSSTRTASQYDEERKRLEELVAEMRRRATVSESSPPS